MNGKEGRRQGWMPSSVASGSVRDVVTVASRLNGSSCEGPINETVEDPALNTGLLLTSTLSTAPCQFSLIN